MAAIHLMDEDLARMLSAHPRLRKRVESLLLAVEDEAGELKEADAAEMLRIEEMQRMSLVFKMGDADVPRMFADIGKGAALCIRAGIRPRDIDSQVLRADLRTQGVHLEVGSVPGSATERAPAAATL